MNRISKLVFLFAAIIPSLASAQQRDYTPDPLVGEWLDKSSNTLAQTYIDKTSGLYCLNISHNPYANEEPDVVLQGKLNGGKLEFSNTEGWTARIDRKKLIAKGPEWSFKGERVDRVSPTLGLPAPENAEILFDGTNLDCWGAVEEKEWLKGSRPASEAASIVNGYLEIIPGQGSLVTKDFYKDYHMHLEFRLLGEKTNGGVYLHSRYELNIGDSWGIGKGNPTGTFGNIKTPEHPAPAYNYALPPMVWQTMDIDFTAPRLNDAGQKVSNARITMYLNGNLIYDDVEVDKVKGAAGKLGEAELGPIYLQEHGTAYQFNNIWIVRK
ncbi:MAG: DUF1080 domain-containing protein [Bacteroidales bacterium]|nr:DUF1080 domain-containing protein [Bacteroidales bacterium]